MPIMPCGMDNRINDHRIADHPEDDAVRKTMGIGPAHLPVFLLNPIEERITRQLRHRCARRPEELTSQSRLLLFIPLLGFE